MERVQVESSNIASIGYDAESMILEVEFNSGSIYQYFDVPESEHNGIMEADSHGKYLNENIKGVYKFKQVL